MLRFALFCAAIMLAAYAARPEPPVKVAPHRAGLDLGAIEARMRACYPTHPAMGSLLKFASPAEREVAHAAASGRIGPFTLRGVGTAVGMHPSVIACLRQHTETRT